MEADCQLLSCGMFKFIDMLHACTMYLVSTCSSKACIEHVE